VLSQPIQVLIMVFILFTLIDSKSRFYIEPSPGDYLKSLNLPKDTQPSARPLVTKITTAITTTRLPVSNVASRSAGRLLTPRS
jgi:hypothetical protein